MIPTEIISVDLKDQEYPTLGDYGVKDGKRWFKITRTGNDLYDDLIFLHEFAEEVLTRAKGIKAEDITKFDLFVEEEVKKGNYPADAEPGEHPLSIYKQEHTLAEILEALMLNHLNISFKEYNDNLMKNFTDADH